MSTGQGHHGSGRDESLYVDKDGIPHYNGDPLRGEEWAERAILGLVSCINTDAKKAYPLRLKNALNGRAWTMCHKKDEITADKLVTLAAANPEGPMNATRLLIETIRKTCEKAAPLKKRDAFEDFFRRGARASHESIQDYIARREAEYERMTSLSADTKVSSDLRTFFLLDLANISADQHRAILGQCAHEYDWDAITAAMTIQLDAIHHRDRQPRFGRAYNTSYDDSISPSDSISAVNVSQGSQVAASSASTMDPIGEDDPQTIEAMVADL